MSDAKRKTPARHGPNQNACGSIYRRLPKLLLLMRQEFEGMLARKADEEAVMWQRCVGLDPLAHQVQRVAIVRRSEASPSFDDFFFLPDENA